MKNILILDDEKTILEVLTNALPRMIPGSKPTAFSDIIQIVTTMEILAQGNKVHWPDLVISDYHLPNGTGDVVLQFAAKLFPDAKLILMSGGADEKLLRAARKKVPRDITFLQKPFSLAHLREAIVGDNTH